MTRRSRHAPGAGGTVARASRLLVAGATIVLVGGPPAARAALAASETQDSSRAAASAVEFARQLESLGESDRAVTEYLRALWLAGWDSSATTTAALEGVARSHALAQDYGAVLRWSEQVSSRSLSSCRLTGVHLIAADACLRLDRPRDAQILLDRVASCASDTGSADRRAFLLGISNLELGRWSEAGSAFASVPAWSSLAAVSREYRALAPGGASLPRRRPGLARLLAILPGVGYFYCGMPQTGAAALIVTGVFAEATREAFRADQNALGGFLAAFGASWYFGSIYGSGKSAERVNRFHRQSFLDRFHY